MSAVIESESSPVTFDFDTSMNILGPKSENKVLTSTPLYFSSLKELPGQEAAILSYIDPLVAVVVGVVILGEPLNWQQMAGGLMILGFTLWNELDISK